MKTAVSFVWLLTMVAAGAQAPERAPSASMAQAPVPAENRATEPQSAWYTELSKLAQAGVGTDVMLSFVDSAGTFNLNADRIVSLRDQGVSDEVVNSVLRHDTELAQGLRNGSSSTSPLPPRLILVKVPAGSPPVQPKPLNPAESIIGTQAEPDHESDENSPQTEDVVAPAAPEMASTLPVRLPHPVQLTDTIVMMRLAGRAPNVQVLVSFP